jgi:hypothetical protein
VTVFLAGAFATVFLAGAFATVFLAGAARVTVFLAGAFVTAFLAGAFATDFLAGVVAGVLAGVLVAVRFTGFEAADGTYTSIMLGPVGSKMPTKFQRVPNPAPDRFTHRLADMYAPPAP